jgi:hypothetical protein
MRSLSSLMALFLLLPCLGHAEEAINRANNDSDRQIATLRQELADLDPNDTSAAVRKRLGSLNVMLGNALRKTNGPAKARNLDAV